MFTTGLSYYRKIDTHVPTSAWDEMDTGMQIGFIHTDGQKYGKVANGGEQMMETRCFLILFAAFLLLTIRNLKEEFIMSDLRNVSLELQRMQREMKKKEQNGNLI